MTELERLQYRVRLASPEMRPDGYFAGTLAKRAAELQAALLDDECDAMISARGGYGTGPLLDQLNFPHKPRPKLVIGYSDLTMLQAYVWTKWRWVTFYGPMVA
ncbi:MAG: LD-carboxypeptidase, partial [Chthoniobacterales bacterium]